MRFLWVKSATDNDFEIEEFRFTRAILVAGPSPFILSAAVRYHLSKYKEEIKELVQDVDQSLYVDDYISGGDNAEELISRKQKLVQIFEEGGFCLRKWFSNDAIVREKINEEATEEQRKVLGVTWQLGYDILLVDLNLTASLLWD
eukprot:gene21330-biopygen16363